MSWYKTEVTQAVKKLLNQVGNNEKKNRILNLNRYAVKSVLFRDAPP